MGGGGGGGVGGEVWRAPPPLLSPGGPPSLPPLTPSFVFSLALPPSNVLLLVPRVVAAWERFLEVLPCRARRLQQYFVAEVLGVWRARAAREAQRCR